MQIKALLLLMAMGAFAAPPLATAAEQNAAKSKAVAAPIEGENRPD
ncbi:hypothetical protein [Paenibacillus sp. GCM10027626]